MTDGNDSLSKDPPSAQTSAEPPGGRTVNVNAPGGHVQVGDHNVQSMGQGVPETKPPAGAKAPETWAALAGTSVEKLPGVWGRRSLPAKVGIVLLVVIVAAVFALAYLGTPIKALFWPDSKKVENMTTTAAGSIALGAMSAPPSEPKEPSINVHAPGGQVQVGNNNVQNQTVVQAPRWVPPPQGKRDELIAQLRKLPVQRFVVSMVGEDRASDVGNVMQADLVKAGWTPEVGPLTALAFAGDPPRGMLIDVKATSPVSDYLNQWCREAGLPAGVFVELKPDDPASVRIMVGRFPDRVR